MAFRDAMLCWLHLGFFLDNFQEIKVLLGKNNGVFRQLQEFGAVREMQILASVGNIALWLLQKCAHSDEVMDLNSVICRRSYDNLPEG